MYIVNLPDIGEGVVEGEIIAWLKPVGALLKQDEPVVVVMTDKATVELPAPIPGRLVKQHYQPGEIAKKDKPLYEIEPLQEELIPSPSVPPTDSSLKSTAAPPIRLLAKKLNIDINQVQGTGKEGRVTEGDLHRFHSPQFSTEFLPGDTETPLIGIRKLMAKKMVESKNQIPHFSYFQQVDATRLVQLRERLKEEAISQGITVTYTPLLIRALSLSLKQYPLVNSSIDPALNHITTHHQHNIGIAMSTEHGLIVPVFKNVQELTLEQIIKGYEELKAKALHAKLLPSEMKDSTITLTNFGAFGEEGVWATPIINYPEAAILGIARIRKQPLVRNETLVIRDILNLSWSFDHRIIDGDLAATFSHYFSMLLQNPAPLL
jgi:pyruvate dehydrogenase E2 component (dihydrolipoamide acetyltransferase)/2-oxoisovalerate dehydrogenase E2 component (dihydrolipoyl transacylase)